MGISFPSDGGTVLISSTSSFQWDNFLASCIIDERSARLEKSRVKVNRRSLWRIFETGRSLYWISLSIRVIAIKPFLPTSLQKLLSSGLIPSSQWKLSHLISWTCFVWKTEYWRIIAINENFKKVLNRILESFKFQYLNILKMYNIT